MRICDTTLDPKLGHLTTRDGMRSLEKEIATIKVQTAHLVTKADVYLYIGMASPVAVAAVSIAIKLIFYNGS